MPQLWASSSAELPMGPRTVRGVRQNGAGGAAIAPYGATSRVRGAPKCGWAAMRTLPLGPS
eukprot:6747595-Pyramimonas_sp.AAC.1